MNLFQIRAISTGSQILPQSWTENLAAKSSFDEDSRESSWFPFPFCSIVKDFSILLSTSF